MMQVHKCNNYLYCMDSLYGVLDDVRTCVYISLIHVHMGVYSINI